jgi:hypothetical protein
MRKRHSFDFYVNIIYLTSIICARLNDEFFLFLLLTQGKTTPYIKIDQLFLIFLTRRLKEYEAMLYLSFKDTEGKCIYEDARLPANFPDHVKEFEAQPVSVILVV